MAATVHRLRAHAAREGGTASFDAMIAVSGKNAA